MTTTETAAPGTGAPGAEHTAREIAQQPAVWREVGARAAAARERTEAFLRPLLELDDLRVVLTGAGTSAFAGQVLAPALSRRLGRTVEALPTTTVVADPRAAFPQDRPTLLVSFARSGDSPESLAATRLAGQLLPRCHHLVLTCNPRGRLARDHADDERSLVVLMPPEADDQGFAMTSSFTGMLLAALLVLDRTAPDPALVEQLAGAGRRALEDLDPLARRLAQDRYERVVYLGSGPLEGLARESALKLLELTAGRVVAYHDSPLGFRHGPKAVLDERTLVVVYVSADPHTRRYDLDLVAELAGAPGGGRVLALSATGDDLPVGAQVLEGLAGLDDAAAAPVLVLLAQLLGLHTSLAHGLAPDDPFPSGEVNRVVQGVTIHPLATAADERR